MSQPTTLVWFRSDLRTADNLALYHAFRDTDPVIGLFTICPKQWLKHDWGDARVDFLLRSLSALSAALAECNVPLLIREVPTFGGVPDLIADLCAEHNVSNLCFNDEYELNESHRDEAVSDRLAEQDVTVHRFTDRVILRPGRVLTKQDTWYTVFTPFKKAWLRTLTEDGLPALRKPPRPQDKLPLESDTIPTSVAGFDASNVNPDLWKTGEAHARTCLNTFIAQRSGDYPDMRDFPGADGTSTLSPYLTHGIISPRRCFAAAAGVCGGIPAHNDTRGSATWINELIWREFYTHLLSAFPRLSMHRPFRLDTESITWNDDEEAFTAWKEGRTGYPIVDAAQRQLLQTGWMHNRLRMITAMFLTKDLFIDWRRGEQHFMRHLIDGDLAANNGGWQWSASTGTDAAPYFRIFNPTSQSGKFDADGDFIRTYVPELAGLDAKTIHNPPPLLRASLDYPSPICDHATARLHAIERFKELKS